MSVQFGGPTMPGIDARVVLRNRAAAPCLVQGWPRLRVVTVDGQPARVSVRRVLATGAWAFRDRPVVVPGHGRRYVSLLIGNPVTNDCRSRLALLRIRPPGAQEATTARLRGSQWQVCPRHTVVAVSPVHD